MNHKLGAAAVAVLVALAACGEGGGDASAPPPENLVAAALPPDSVAGFAYVANQGSDNVSAYAIDARTGTLVEVAGSPFAAGTGPESVSVHPSGKFAYVANFGSGIVPGSVSAYAIDAGTGALSEITGSPFAAGGTLTTDVAVDPSGRFAYVVNIYPGDPTGTSPNEVNFSPGDVSAYTIDATTGALSRVGAAVAAGFNPNAIAVDPSGRFAYVANFEGDFVSNVFAYTIDAGTGALSEVAGSPYAAGSDPHAVTVDPSGRFVYVASGQSANISAYAIDTGTGALSAISGSPFAGGIQLAVDPTGKFAYVAGGANGILAYTINATTGALTGIGAFSAGDSPTQVTVDPSGQFAYAVNRGGNDVSAYSINATSGALTSIGAAVAAGIRPQAITTTRTMR